MTSPLVAVWHHGDAVSERRGSKGRAAHGGERAGRRGRGIRVGGHGLERAESSRQGRPGHRRACARRDRGARLRPQRRRSAAARGPEPVDRARRARRAQPLLHGCRPRRGGSRGGGRHDHPPRQQRREHRPRGRPTSTSSRSSGCTACSSRRSTDDLPRLARLRDAARRSCSSIARPRIASYLLGRRRRRRGRRARRARTSPRPDVAGSRSSAGRSAIRQVADRLEGARRAVAATPGHDARGHRDRLADGAAGSRGRRGDPGACRRRRGPTRCSRRTTCSPWACCRRW